MWVDEGCKRPAKRCVTAAARLCRDASMHDSTVAAPPSGALCRCAMVFPEIATGNVTEGGCPAEKTSGRRCKLLQLQRESAAEGVGGPADHRLPVDAEQKHRNRQREQHAGVDGGHRHGAVVERLLEEHRLDDARGI